MELLWAVFDWLPVVFAIDVVAFHFTGDHPLALRWWWRPARKRRDVLPYHADHGWKRRNFRRCLRSVAASLA